jgi:hypothetical protein
MKNILHVVKLFGVCAMVAVLCVSAQGRPDAIVNVPFDFVVCNTTLPAGQYSVNIDRVRGSITVRGEDTDAAVIALANTAYAKKPLERPELVFQQYGTRYFLSQVWPIGGGDGRELVPSKMEQELARTAGKPEIVTLLVSGPGFRRPSH